MSRFRIVAFLDNKMPGRDKLHCDVCKNNISLGKRAAKGNKSHKLVVVALAPIDAKDQDIEIDHISRFYVCYIHFIVLVEAGVIESAVRAEVKL
jgi:hypothetical protein